MFIPDFHEEHADHDPEDFADAGVERHVDADGLSHAGEEEGNDDGQTALARADLHREEEEEVAHQRGETENDEAVDEIGTRNAEGEEDEVEFKRVEQAPEVFGGQRTPKLARMFVEETDVGVDGVEGRCVAFVEAARGTAQQGHEKEQAKQAGDDAVLVTVGKKDGGGHEHREENGKKRPEPSGHHVEMRDDEGQKRRGPEEEVAEHMHHGVEGYRRNGARGADVAREFHDTIGRTARSEGRGVGKCEARNGEFEGVCEGKVLVVVGSVDQNLECPRVAEVDKEPNADYAGEIEQHVGGIALDRFPSLGEGVDHEGDGAESEEEKEVAVEGLHALAGAVD